jgi:Transglycosylase
VYFGEGAYGVEAAAWTYFSTHASRLTLPQAAMLAGLVRPSGYDPFTRPAAALARRAEVLRRMQRLGHLQPGQAARAAAAPLGLRPGPSRERRYPATWFVRWAIDQLLDPADSRFAVLGQTRQARVASVFPTRRWRRWSRAAAPCGRWWAAATTSATGVSGASTWPPARAARAGRPGRRSRRSPWSPRWSRESRRGGVRRARAGDLAAGRRRELHGANYESQGFGEATLRQATAASVNTVYAQLLLRLGHGDPDRGGQVVAATGRSASPWCLTCSACRRRRA